MSLLIHVIMQTMIRGYISIDYLFGIRFYFFLTLITAVKSSQSICTIENDQACGDQSKVVFFAEEGVTYYIFVSAYYDYDAGAYTFNMDCMLYFFLFLLLLFFINLFRC